MGSLALGQVLLAHSLLLLQNVQHFSLERDASGKVVLEDGKGRCPFDPEYRSTAVMVGKARHPGTLVLPPLPSLCHPGALTLPAVPWDLCPLPCASASLCVSGQAEPRPGYRRPRREAGPCWWHVAGPSGSLSLADGELYAGTVSNFQGNEPTISRSQESRIALKTENSLNWLQGECWGWHGRSGSLSPAVWEDGVGCSGPAVLRVLVPPDPAFVGSAYLRESLPAGNPEGDDDKVYFFFSETGKEFDYFENTIVSRIARVCKVGIRQQWGLCLGCDSLLGWGECGTILQISSPGCLEPCSVGSARGVPCGHGITA